MAGGFRAWCRSFLFDPLKQADEEARNTRDGGGKVVAILVTVAVMLTLQHYFLLPDELRTTLRLFRELGFTSFPDFWEATLGDPNEQRRRWLTYWAFGCLVTYFIIPAVIVRLVFRERLADYGFKLRGAFAYGWLYVLFFGVVGPLVLLVSRSEEFQRTYPFYRVPSGVPLWPEFWRWELLYAMQFVALEFFFRGFMVHGLRRRLGSFAIPVMMVPYCMIHFGKPIPETFAAIIAGLVLGFMSLRTRSIVLGAAIHISVALSMDFTSLWRQGYFG